MRHVERIVLSIMLSFGCMSICHAEEKWTRFAPPLADFTVDMPGPVQQMGEPGNTYFLAPDSHRRNFMVMYQPDRIKLPDPAKFQEKSLDDFFVGFKKSAGASCTFIGAPVSIKGSGWEGRLQNATVKGAPITWIVAISTKHDFFYVLMAAASIKDEVAQHFVDSFKIDPAIVSKAHPGAAAPSSSNIISENLGFITGLVLGVVLMAGAAFFATKRSSAKNSLKDESRQAESKPDS